MIYCSQQEYERRINKQLEYAERIYGCVFPKNYSKHLYSIAYQDTIPSNKVIDSIVREWKEWSDYVLETEFNAFVRRELESILQFQACSTISIQYYNTFIGKKVNIREDVTIPHKITAVTMFGDFLLDGIKIG